MTREEEALIERAYADGSIFSSDDDEEEEALIERAYADGSIFSSDDERTTVIEVMAFCDCPFCTANHESKGGPVGGGRDEASPES